MAIGDVWNPRAAASSALAFIYDIPTVSSPDDPTVKNINRFMDIFVDYASPGNYLVEFFPWMLYIPESLAKWKREANAAYRFFSGLFTRMFHDVEIRIVSHLLLFLFFLPFIHGLFRTKGMSVQVLLGH